MTIGFIGLGAMGARMARRLVAAGYDVTVSEPHAGPRRAAAKSMPC
jgi:3-hydroxyisobutyrate dehydrogenase-like beta-hydroxyacid dehydrogenase